MLPLLPVVAGGGAWQTPFAEQALPGGGAALTMLLQLPWEGPLRCAVLRPAHLYAASIARACMQRMRASMPARHMRPPPALRDGLHAPHDPLLLPAHACCCAQLRRPRLPREGWQQQLAGQRRNTQRLFRAVRSAAIRG